LGTDPWRDPDPDSRDVFVGAAGARVVCMQALGGRALIHF
jgi:hypothetical protein